MAAGAFEERLAQAVQQLARPGEDVLASGAPGSRIPERMALEFDEAYTTYVEHLDQLPSEAQFRSLQKIDSALSAMMGPENASLWTDESLKKHPHWAEVRSLAREAMAQFSWVSTPHSLM